MRAPGGIGTIPRGLVAPLAQPPRLRLRPRAHGLEEQVLVVPQVLHLRGELPVPPPAPRPQPRPINMCGKPKFEFEMLAILSEWNETSNYPGEWVYREACKVSLQYIHLVKSYGPKTQCWEGIFL